MNKSEITKERYLEVAQKYNFTKRELELAYLKISGFSNRRIAFIYGISEIHYRVKAVELQLL